jgi:hypothetical protein
LAGIAERDATLVIQALAEAAGQTWLSDESFGAHADLLTTLDNFLRSSPKVTDALAAFLAAETVVPVPGFAATLLIAEVSSAARWFRQMTSCGGDDPVQRIGVKFPPVKVP